MMDKSAFEDLLRKVVVETLLSEFHRVHEDITDNHAQVIASIEVVQSAIESKPLLSALPVPQDPVEPIQSKFKIPKKHSTSWRPPRIFSATNCETTKAIRRSFGLDKTEKTPVILGPGSKVLNPVRDSQSMEKADTFVPSISLSSVSGASDSDDSEWGGINRSRSLPGKLPSKIWENLPRCLDSTASNEPASQRHSLKNETRPSLCKVSSVQSSRTLHVPRPEEATSLSQSLALSGVGSALSRSIAAASISGHSVLSGHSVHSAASMGSLGQEVLHESCGPMDIYKIDAMYTDKMIEAAITERGSRVIHDKIAAEIASERGSRVVSDRISCQSDLSLNDVLNSDSYLSLTPNLPIINAYDSNKQFNPKSSLSLCGPLSSMDALRASRELEMLSRVRQGNHRATPCQEEEALTPECISLGWIMQTPQLLFKLYGLQRSTTIVGRWCSHAVLLVLVLLLVLYTHHAASEVRFVYMRLSGICPTFGGLFGFVLLRLANIETLLGNHILERYARSHGFFQEWQIISMRSFFVVFALTVCAVVMGIFVMPSLSFSSSNVFTAPPAFIYPTLSCGLFAMLIYCQIHVCSALELMVDKFCIRFFEKPDFSNAVEEWTVLQALLRRSADTIDSCILTVHTSILVALLLLAAEVFVGDGGPEVSQGMRVAVGAVSNLSLALLALYGLFRSAAVTEKCSRVPALLNSLRFEGSPINHDRQYLVQYVQQSAAGFYIKGVRLTVFMVMKMTYLAGIVAFSFVTRMASG